MQATHRQVTLTAAEHNRVLTLCGAQPDLVELFKYAKSFQPATNEQLGRAQDIYGSDDCEVDPGAGISDPEDGTGYWVQAWVWVSA